MEEEKIINSHNTGYIPVRKHRQRMISLAVVLILIIVIMLSVGGFVLFRITTGGRLALREAKNIRLAMMAVDIEAYASGKSIYAPERADGLAAGSLEKIAVFADINGDIKLNDYNRMMRAVTGLSYKKDRYLVTFYVDEKGVENWKVDYMVRIMDY